MLFSLDVDRDAAAMVHLCYLTVDEIRVEIRAASEDISHFSFAPAPPLKLRRKCAFRRRGLLLETELTRHRAVDGQMLANAGCGILVLCLLVQGNRDSSILGNTSG